MSLQDYLPKKILILVTIMLLLIILYILYSHSFRLNIEVLVNICLLIGLLTILFLMRLNLQLNKDEISFSMLGVKRKIALDSIDEISIDNNWNAWKFGGLGIRITVSGDVGFVLGGKNLFRIRLKSGKTYYVSFSANEKSFTEIVSFLKENYAAFRQN